MFRKIKRLLDGEEIDFDAVMEYAVERKAGVTPPTRSTGAATRSSATSASPSSST